MKQKQKILDFWRGTWNNRGRGTSTSYSNPRSYALLLAIELLDMPTGSEYNLRRKKGTDMFTATEVAKSLIAFFQKLPCIKDILKGIQ